MQSVSAFDTLVEVACSLTSILEGFSLCQANHAVPPDGTAPTTPAIIGSPHVRHRWRVLGHFFWHSKIPIIAINEAQAASDWPLGGVVRSRLHDNGRQSADVPDACPDQRWLYAINSVPALSNMYVLMKKR